MTTRSQATAKVGSDDGIADVEAEVIEIWEDFNEKKSFEIELSGLSTGRLKDLQANVFGTP